MDVNMFTEVILKFLIKTTLIQCILTGKECQWMGKCLFLVFSVGNSLPHCFYEWETVQVYKWASSRVGILVF